MDPYHHPLGSTDDEAAFVADLTNWVLNGSTPAATNAAGGAQPEMFLEQQLQLPPLHAACQESAHGMCALFRGAASSGSPGTKTFMLETQSGEMAGHLVVAYGADGVVDRPKTCYATLAARGTVSSPLPDRLFIRGARFISLAHLQHVQDADGAALLVLADPASTPSTPSTSTSTSTSTRSSTSTSSIRYKVSARFFLATFERWFQES